MSNSWDAVKPVYFKFQYYRESDGIWCETSMQPPNFDDDGRTSEETKWRLYFDYIKATSSMRYRLVKVTTVTTKDVIDECR